MNNEIKLLVRTKVPASDPSVIVEVLLRTTQEIYLNLLTYFYLIYFTLILT